MNENLYYRTVNLSDDYRVRVFLPDFDSRVESPADRYDCVIYSVDTADGPIIDGKSDIIERLDRAARGVRDYDWDSDDSVADALVKSLERAGYDATRISAAGDTPGDWADLVIGVKTGDGVNLAGLIGDVRRWYANECFDLEYQSRHVWHDDTGATLETWDTVDTLFAVEFEDVDDDSEVARYTRHYFEGEAA